AVSSLRDAASAPADVYALSLHDALPISLRVPGGVGPRSRPAPAGRCPRHVAVGALGSAVARHDRLRNRLPRSITPAPPLLRFLRSEEHTSELQSRENLVCRLLLEKKKDG